ncbi:RHS domain-containing protein [Burkholderia cenocepacia]|nr:RHS domain-containing protein [Burkholderia cenocepacia]
MRRCYCRSDQIGTPQLLTGDAGDVVWEASYKVRGEAWDVIAWMSKPTATVPKNPLQFHAQ